MASEPEYAAELAVAECMQGKGYVYVPVPREAFDLPPLPETHEPDVSYLRQYGYGPPPTPPETDSASTIDLNQGFAGLPPEQQQGWSEALEGREDQRVSVPIPKVGGVVSYPGAGCRAEVAKRLFGDLQTYVAVDFLRGNIHNLARVNVRMKVPEIAEANKQWADCMSGMPIVQRLGARLQSPDDALDYAESFVATNEGASHESGVSRELASADADCQEPINYTQARTGVEDRYIEAYMTLLEGQIAAGQDMYRGALARYDETGR